MNKLKMGIIAVAVLFGAAQAAAVVTNALATDEGGIPVNHSQGVAVFNYSKLKAAASNKTIPYYTTAAAWPTTFVPQSITYDGGTGCVKRTMTETPITNTPSGLTSSGLPLFCIINVPFGSLDAGTYTIYKDLDGGYGLSTCPGSVTVPTTAWPAFCYRQAGISP